MKQPNSRGRPPIEESKRATSQIHLRLTRRRKAAYVRAAQPGTLTNWMFQVCDKAAGFQI